MPQQYRKSQAKERMVPITNSCVTEELLGHESQVFGSKFGPYFLWAIAKHAKIQVHENEMMETIAWSIGRGSTATSALPVVASRDSSTSLNQLAAGQQLKFAPKNQAEARSLLLISSSSVGKFCGTLGFCCEFACYLMINQNLTCQVLHCISSGQAGHSKQCTRQFEGNKNDIPPDVCI